MATPEEQAEAAIADTVAKLAARPMKRYRDGDREVEYQDLDAALDAQDRIRARADRRRGLGHAHNVAEVLDA